MELYLTNYVSEFGNEFFDVDGEHAYLEELDSISMEDIMNERWYIYES